MGLIDTIKRWFEGSESADPAADAERRHLEDEQLSVRASQGGFASTVAPTPDVVDPDADDRT
jgi:hypothetical protein